MAHKIKSLKFILLFLLLFPFGEINARGDDVSYRAHALMQAFFDANLTPGLVVTVGRGGKIVWSEGFGYADLEQSVPADPAKTRFRIGSVVKPMTAFATAQLVQAGSLDLDVPIQTYLPDFPQKPKPISTRQLLGHL